jgi:hypothetical protein
MYPLGVDQGVFTYIGNVILNRGLPYRDAWDIKPPAVFYEYSLARLLFRDPVIACRLLDIASTALTCWLLVLLCHRLGKKGAGLLVSFLYLCCYWFEFNFWHTAQAEGLASPATVAAVLLVMPATNKKRLPLVAGICISFVILLKSTLILLAAVPIYLLVKERIGTRGFVAFLLGMSLLPAAFLVSYSALGSIAEVRGLFQAQAAYAASSGGFDGERFRKIVFGLFEFYPLTYILTTLSIVLLLSFAHLRRSYLLWIWIIVFWIQLIWQNKYLEYHFVPMLLPVSLICGLGLHHIWRLLQSKLSNSTSRLANILVSPVFAFLVIRNIAYFVLPLKVLTGSMPIEQYNRFFVYNFYSYPDSLAAAKDVQRLSLPNDPVLVYGFDPTIYILSNRFAPTRHFSNAPIRLKGWFPDSMRKQFFEELKADVTSHPPKVLVTDFQIDWGLEASKTDLYAPIKFCGIPYTFVSQHHHLYVYRRSNS